MAAPSQLVGHTLGHYHIMEQIGAGGMGVVYRAHDEQLERDVAIKVLPVGALVDEAARKRFRKEALTLAKLNHPNIATIFEFSSQENTDYLVTEYISGLTLDHKLASGALSEKEVVSLGIQLAQGLSAAHEHGIVHRDLKPANLRLASDGRLKILDFGLAQLMSHPNEVGTTATLTQSQEVTGTLPYMAPEQLRGEPAEVRTDIWAAGAVLYEMATAHRPFEEKVPTALAGDILHKDPPPPRRLRSQLSSKLGAVILKCLEKEQAKRYQSARELQSDLERLGTGVTPTTVQQRWMWPAIAATLMVVLMSGSFSWYLLSRRVARSTASAIHARRSVAVLGFKNLSGKPEVAWLSTAFSEMLNTELAAGEKLRTVSGEDVAHTKFDLSLPDTDSLGKETLARLRKNLGSDFIVLGSYLDLGGQVRLDLRLQDAIAGETVTTVSEIGSESDLLELVARTGERLRERLGVGSVSATEAATVRASMPSNPEAARLYSEGLVKLRVFDALGARDLLQKAITADSTFALAHSALSETWSALGYDQKAKEEANKAFDLSANLRRADRLLIEGRHREANKEQDKAIEVYKALVSFFPDDLEYGLHLVSAQANAGKVQDSLTAAESLRKLPAPARDDPRIDLLVADSADAVGNFQQAEAAADSALEKAKAQGTRLLVARALVEKAGVLIDLGRTSEAISSAEEAGKSYLAAGDRKGRGHALDTVGGALWYRGDLNAAKSAFQEALAIYREIGDQGDVGNSMNSMGLVLRDQGELAEARKMLDQSRFIAGEIGDQRGIAFAEANAAWVEHHLGNLAKAKNMYDRALAKMRRVGAKDTSVYVLTLFSDVLIEQGEFVQAREFLEQASKTAQQTGSKPGLAFTLSTLGALLRIQGDIPGARKAFSEALALRQDFGAGFWPDLPISAAQLSIEEGLPADAERSLRAALEEFRKHKETDREVAADALLALAILAQGNISDAGKEIEAARPLFAASQDITARLRYSIAAAQVHAALGRPSEGKAQLRVALAEATKHGFLDYELEARLALAEIELKSGQTAIGRAHLQALEREAKTKGFLLIARKAAAAAKG